MNKKLFLFFFFSLSASLVNATNYFVAKNGNDQNSGLWFSPFLTINKAAQIAKAGDSIFIRAGIYREHVNPLNSGLINQPIVYQAYNNEKVIIKGSEQISNWQQQSNGIWSCTILNSFFGNFNPYIRTLKGAFLYGGWQHLGNIFIDDNQLVEVANSQFLSTVTNSWYVTNNNTSITISANFGNKNPNIALTEILVRKTIFTPQLENLSYIELYNLSFSQSATRWQSPQDGEQDGLVATNGGHHWKIENCYFSHAKCSAISLGIPTSGNKVRSKNHLTTGHHIVRNNHIEKCGEAGVCGAGSFASFSVISNNIVDSINYTNEFGGYENSGLKFHNSVDLQILQNQIKNIGPTKNESKGNGWGIWIDFCNQGTKVSGNFIVNCYNEAIMVECNLGPILIDNNICIGNVFLFGSQGIFAVHNLFIDTHVSAFNDPSRLLWYYQPHTIDVRGVGIPTPPSTLEPGTISATVKNFKFVNNIFINSSLANLPKVVDAVSDYNIFYQSSLKTNWDDLNSIDNQLFNTLNNIILWKDSFLIKFKANGNILQQKHPFITKSYIGISKTSQTQQGIETKEAKPINIDYDIAFQQRDTNNIIPGPFKTVQNGDNTFGFKAGNTLVTSVKNPLLLVQLTDFNIVESKCKLRFNWKSQVDTSLLSYVIEKNETGTRFQAVSTIQPRCITYSSALCNYGSEIVVSDSLLSTYRLKLIYKNGVTEYAFATNKQVLCDNNFLEVYPNPATNKITMLYKNKRSAITTIIQIIDVNGRILYRQNVKLNKGNNFFSISTERFPRGFLTVKAANESLIIQKI